MSLIYDHLHALDAAKLRKAVLSRPRPGCEHLKCAVSPVIVRGQRQYQFTRHTQKQVFHENVPADLLWRRVAEAFDEDFRQLDLFMADGDRSFRETKRGDISATHRPADLPSIEPPAHNRQKQYPLPEGEVVPALVDLGVITAAGHVAAAMYDKYKQINRFLELVADVLPEKTDRPLRIVDFGCGKSYLTFVLYHYLTKVRGFSVEMTGLDLKSDVVAFCSDVARKYGYDALRFSVGDIAGYDGAGELDMMVSLHACDTATDSALYAAVARKTGVILSVPCCQHELNAQIATDRLDALTEYGILRERFSALATDALRGCLLEAAGYRTQVLEFIDLAHSPKNLLIRARRGGLSVAKRTAALQKAERLMEEFGFTPTLYRLFEEAGYFTPLRR